MLAEYRVRAMEIKSVDSQETKELKLRIARQQQLLAFLERAGRRQEARFARAELFRMLNRLDTLEFLAYRPIT